VDTLNLINSRGLTPKFGSLKFRELEAKTMQKSNLAFWVLGAGLVCLPLAAEAVPAVKLELPLNRVAYQDNEPIELAVVRTDNVAALAAGVLSVSLTGSENGTPNGSVLTFDFPEEAAPLVNGSAEATEHLQFNGSLLRPGTYAVQVTSDGTTATTDFEIYSHIRKSSYRVGIWGTRAKGADQLVEGADGMGYNLVYGSGFDQNNLIRAGIDYMNLCTMGGGHQMDLRTECDWSDPYVLQGGTTRVVHRALIDRTSPNVIGVHFYDEPGLTWWNNPDTQEWTPHGVPAQVRSYTSAFGAPPPAYNKLDPKDPENVAQWDQWAKWKLGFMDAAWKDAKFGVDQVRPDYISATQSQYGWTAFTDGYYFNVARSLDIVSGHGGYDDIGPGYYTPSLFLEFARARAADKPNWYLPTWYGGTPADRVRVEQYLSFSTGIQGIMTPPELDPHHPAKLLAGESIIEANKTMARLGTAFTTLKPNPAPVAVLYSLSQVLHDQEAAPQKNNYAQGLPHGQGLYDVYVATKTIQQPIQVVLDEDVKDGTLAANNKAVILAAITYLDPKVVTGLTNFAAHGGTVIEACGSTVEIPGAVKLDAVPIMPDAAAIAKVMATKKYTDLIPYQTVVKHLQAVGPMAKQLQAALRAAGIAPAFACDSPGIAANRQAAGDIEYLFAINTTPDRTKLTENRLVPTEATITLAADNRPIYDALIGGPATQFKATKAGPSADLRFGPGQMRVWARTARPIGSIKAAEPLLQRDYTGKSPLGVQISAALLDTSGGLLSASAPLDIRLLDPQGHARYDLYRATSQGVYHDFLPLALNDPPGTWTFEVRDLLAGTTDQSHFDFATSPQAGAVAGVEQRAVSFGNDRDNIFRFFRNHQDVSLVIGSSDYDELQARRLMDTLQPWNINATIVNAADVKPRDLTPDEAPTWIGLNPTKAVPGDTNSPAISGFALRGACVLIGTPEDNPLIKFVAANKFLPYLPSVDEFPGRGRGYMAWQEDALGRDQESVTLIAYDSAGMAEAAGTLYEAAAGLEPLTPTAVSLRNSLTPASTFNLPSAAAISWQVALSDKAVSMAPDGANLAVSTLDDSVSTLDAHGNLLSSNPLPTGAPSAAPPAYGTVPDALAAKVWADHRVKWVAASDSGTAIGYWGGGLQVFDAAGNLKTQQTFPQDIAAVAWLGSQLAVGLSDGRVLGLQGP